MIGIQAIFATYSSIIIRIILAIVFFPLILKYDANFIAAWLFGQLLNRFRDIFDFGYMDSISRVVSYELAAGKLGAVKAIFKLSIKKYFRNASYYLIISLFIAAAWMQSKALWDNTEVLIFFTALNLSNALHIIGNSFVSCLYGINKIRELKMWDSIFSFIALMIAIFFPFATNDFLALALIMPILNASIVIRNSIFALYLIAKNLSAPLFDSFNNDQWNSIVFNANREFRASINLSILHQGTSFLVSFFLPLAVSNTFVFIEQISEHIRNLSRVPFYVSRPKITMLYKANGVMPFALINRLIFISLSLLLLGFCFFYLFGPWFFAIIGSKFLSDNALVLFFFVFSLFERLSAMINQVILIKTNEVVLHKYSLVMLFVGIIFGSLVFIFNLPVIWICIGYIICYGVVLLFPLLFTLKKIHAEPI